MLCAFAQPFQMYFPITDRYQTTFRLLFQLLNHLSFNINSLNGSDDVVYYSVCFFSSSESYFLCPKLWELRPGMKPQVCPGSNCSCQDPRLLLIQQVPPEWVKWVHEGLAMQMPPHWSPAAGTQRMSRPLKSQSMSQRVKPPSPNFQTRADTVVIDTAAINKKIDKTDEIFFILIFI